MLSEEARIKIKKLKKNQKENQEYALHVDLQIQREEWESFAKKDIPEGILVESTDICDVHGDWLHYEIESNDCIFYFHGGGLNQGSSLTHRNLVANIVKYTKTSLFIHDYPLAPEYPFPEALESSVKIYQELLKMGKNARNIIIGADSSGAALALSVCLKLKQLKIILPKTIFLLSPMLDFSLSGESLERLKERDFRVFKEDLEYTVSYYCKPEEVRNPLVSPLFGELEDFPPTLIQVGSEEVLLSDATRFYEALNKAGVKTELRIWEGLWHVFQSEVQNIPESLQAVKEIAEYIKNGQQ